MRFDITGYNIDNLVKTLHIKRIKIFDVERTASNKISFSIEDKDRHKIKRHIANFKISQRFTGIKKVPKLMLANVGLLIGVLVGIIFFGISSKFTWQILIYGNKEISTDEIISVLAQNGVSTGKINNQTKKEIESILLNNYDRIAQVSVIREGTAIIINLSEKLVYEQVNFEPITAKFAGIVENVKLITGTLNVKLGDYVNVGDVLVLPYNINANGEQVSVQPIAEISGKILVVNKCELPKNEVVLVRSGRTASKYSYKFRNLHLFSTKFKNSFAFFECVFYNEYVSDLIPLSRDVEIYYELEESVVEHNFEQEKLWLEDKCKKQSYEGIPQGEIVAEKTNTITTQDKMITTTEITLNGILNG